MPVGNTAAVLQSLLPMAMGYSGGGASSGVGGEVDGSDDGGVGSVNQLNAQMSMLMQRGGMQKLKILRRAKDDQPGHPPNSGGGARAGAAQTNEQKTAEQREREYEETRAAIFGGQIDALRQHSASPSAPTAAYPANPAARIVKRTPNSSASPAAPQIDDSEADAAPAPIQPSAAALAEVHHHHSKRHEKQQQLQSKRHGAGGGGVARNHRIIDDLVGNRAGGPSTNQRQVNEINDPDFNRHAPRGYAPVYGYGAVPPQMQMQQPYPMAMPAGGIGPGNAYFAAGPQGNNVGFGRGQRIQQAQPQPTRFGTAPPTFNPHATSFNPSAPVFNPAAYIDRSHGPPTQQPQRAPYATPNVYMGSNDYSLPQQPQQQAYQQSSASQASYAAPAASPAPSPISHPILRIAPASLAFSQSQPAAATPPAPSHSLQLADQDEFPSLGGPSKPNKAQ